MFKQGFYFVAVGRLCEAFNDLRCYLFFTDGHNAAVLWALHGYIVPTNRVVKRGVTDKKTTTKHTIKDSQKSVLCVGQNQQEVEERINHLRATNVSIQPALYCLGRDIFSIEDVCVIFDNIRYKFSSILEALDICFKIMYLFDLGFPTESQILYSFIEINFFKFRPTNNANSKVQVRYVNIYQISFYNKEF
nr:unnamed protein product [Callosobruchus analis]